jgi:HPt (histidine-containing phosphotransfer) domain-containing protein
MENNIDPHKLKGNDIMQYALSMRQRCHALENELAQKNERIAKIEDIAKRLFDVVLELLKV